MKTGMQPTRESYVHFKYVTGNMILAAHAAQG